MTPLGYRSPNDLEELLLIQGASPNARNSNSVSGTISGGRSRQYGD
jgi:hypothetical protein